MSRLFRTLCVSLFVALVAVLSLHGVQDGQHQLAHAAEWPTASAAHDDHDRDPAQITTDTIVDRIDQAESNDDDGGAGRPTGHHHHGGGDTHTAIPALGRDFAPLVAANALLIQPAVDGSRPGRTEDGPEHPPKRMRTIL